MHLDVRRLAPEARAVRVGGSGCSGRWLTGTARRVLSEPPPSGGCGPMPTIAMALSIPGDKVDTWLRGMAEIAGPRREEFTAARRRQGVTGTKVWIQEGPGGPLEILVIDAEDPGEA